MSKQMKKLTLEDLLAKKLESEGKVLKEFESSELNGAIEINKISLSKVLKLFDEFDNSDTLQGFNFMQYLIYLSCPIFQDKGLLSQYEVVEPFEIIGKIFNDNVGEITRLSETILELYGLKDGGGLVEAIKKP